MPDPADARRPIHPALAAGALLLVATIICYLPAVQAGFIWDDDSYLTRNPVLTAPDALARIWTPGNTPQYYPLVFTSFWLEMQLWGLAPAGYHLVNILLHAVNALLVWRLFRVLGVPGAWLIAALFALHPVHVESVAWITERKNVLSGLFYLAAALAYLRFDRRFIERVGGAWPWYALAGVLFASALLSKSVAATLPAALVLAMLLDDRPITLRRLAPLAPLLIAGLVAGLHTAALERELVGALGPEFDRGLLDRALVAARALVFYPTKLIAPWPLIFIYPRWRIDPASVAAWWPVVLIIAAAIAAALAWRRGRRGPALALLFYAGTVFPAIGFVNVYPHRYSFVADHFQYLASLGILALLGAAVARWVHPWRLRTAIVALTLVVLGALTMAQSATYRSAESVWRHTLRCNPDAWMPRNNLAGLLLRRAEIQRAAGQEQAALATIAEAREQAAAAVGLKPDHHPAHSNLSEALRLEGRYEEALEHQQRAIELAAQRIADAGATAEPRWMAVEHFQLGRLLELTGDRAGAIEAYRRATEIAPARSSFHLELARTLTQAGEHARAEVAYRAVLELDPSNIAALGTLGALRQQAGDCAEAHGLFRRALEAARSAAEQVQIATRLIRLHVTCPDNPARNLDEARALAERLVSAGGGRDPAALALLASVHAAAGEHERSAALYDEAIERARTLGMPELAAQIEEERAKE